MDDLEFSKTYETYQPKIFRYLTRLVGDSEAEDLTQEVFIKVNQALKNFRGESSLSTWIYRIATNTALDKLRSPSYQQVGHILLENPLDDECAVPVEEKTPSVEKQFIRAEMNECIWGYVEKLPEDYRAILVLSEYEGLKNNEITEILGVTLDTVKIRLHRARTKLKKELQTHCEIHWVEEIPCSVMLPIK